MITNDIQVLSQDRRTIIQTYYKLRYNSRNYTFLDYVYEGTGEPVEGGERSQILDHYGKVLESEDLKEASVERQKIKNSLDSIKHLIKDKK